MDAKIELPPDLMTVLKELHNLSGFRISIYDTSLNELAAYPPSLYGFCALVQRDKKVHEICVSNDAAAFEVVKKTGRVYIYQCKFGLYEAVTPLYYFGVLSGYLMMGQALDTRGDSRDHVFQKSAPYVDDHKRLLEEISKIPSTSKDKILSCINLMSICAGYITLSNRWNTSDKNLASGVRKYINQNYPERITIELLCSRFFCSKSTLINSFKKKYRKTIVQYLTEVRLAQAAKLLENSEDSIYLISQKCGFVDQNYFSKVFSRAYGATPTLYRREHNNNP